MVLVSVIQRIGISHRYTYAPSFLSLFYTISLLFYTATLKHSIICILNYLYYWNTHTEDSKLLPKHSKHFCALSVDNFRNISRNQIFIKTRLPYAPCQPRVRYTVLLPMQCKKTVDLRACEILNKFKPCLGKVYTRRQERLQRVWKAYRGPSAKTVVVWTCAITSALA